MTDRRNDNTRSSNDKAPGGSGGAYLINLDNFGKRLKMLYRTGMSTIMNLSGAPELLAIATPPSLEDLSQKKASLHEVVKKSAEDVVRVEVVMHVKAKSDDGTALMDTVVGAVHAQSRLDGHDTTVVGHIAKEVHEGNLLETWGEKLKSADFQLTDLTNCFSDLFAVKDNAEITNVQKAAYLTSSVIKHFVVPKLEKVINEEKKSSPFSLMDDTEKVILEPAKIKVKLKDDNIDICYPPISQCGGEFDLKLTAAGNDSNLYYDSTSVIICAIGSRYNNYCSNVAHTF